MRTEERKHGLEMAGPLSDMLDKVARRLHNNESLHLHLVTVNHEDCGYCYLRAGHTLGIVAQELELDAFGPTAVEAAS